MARENPIVASSPGAEAGLTLIELMVALAIGSFLMAGAVTVFVQSRTTLRVTESIARLQENARIALAALEPDIRMARYWGLTTRASTIPNRAPLGPPNGIGDDTCGVNWLIDLDHFVQATNNAYGFGCAAFDAPVVNADSLVVRHARATPVVAAALVGKTMYLQTRRFQEGRLFDDGVLPKGFTALNSETHALVVNGYYVNRDSSLGPNIPGLRRKMLRNDGKIVDEEVMSGVEDLQVQFGVDTDVPGSVNRGSIDRYVDADDAILALGSPEFLEHAEILAVRIWLRLRAESPENGFTDTSAYSYADHNVGPFNDGIRRLVVAKTIYLRNARPAS
jgi:type IV pilus assembly protein PilW